MSVAVEIPQTVKQHSTWIEINRAAVLHNLEQITKPCVPGTSVLAVIKANAYGHGLLTLAHCLGGKVQYFGVSVLEEALSLRRSEIETPILLFGIHPQDEVEAAINAKVTLTISSVQQAMEISQIAQKLKKPALAHIKIDTGMGRLGFKRASAVEEISKIISLGMLRIEGLYTHFPQAEEANDEFTQTQIREFYTLMLELEDKGIHFAYRHMSNSSGILNYRDAHLNLVRPGISLYGICPSAKLQNKVNLEPVLAWRTRISLMKQLAPGESCGYNRTFVASKNTHIAILPVGYSHGYAFGLSNVSEVLCHGKRYKVVGKVSMDYIAIELGADDAFIKEGDVVTLLGKEGSQCISAEWLSERAKTIPYEIVTQLNPAIPRILIS